MKTHKKKRILLVSCLSVAALAIGATIAYNQDTLFFNNLFGLGSDTAEFIETFDSPDDWQPCQEIPKEAIAKNKNDSPRYVRMKYDEYWRVKNSQTSADDHSTSDLPLTWNDGGTTKHYAEVLFQNENDWSEQDGWYYYKYPLDTDESTSSLLKSVRLNCDANFAGTTTISPDGQSAHSNPDQYNEATYHLYVTFQLLGEQLLVRDRLYDYVAKQVSGNDANTDFTASLSGNNVVLAHNENISDEHPVFYYRGASDNNFVTLGYFCWRIIRTADNGSVKLLYQGPKVYNSYYPQGFGCSNTGSSTSISTSDMNSQRYNLQGSSRYDGIWMSGYMYDDKYTPEHILNIGNFEFIFGKDVSWDPIEQKYTLVDQWQRDPATTTYQDGIAPVANTYHYTCASNDSATCEEVYYIVYINPTNGYDDTAVKLTGGDKYDDARENAFSNVKNSNAKSVIDSWFSSTMTSYQDKMEDAVYCNDRSIASGYINNGGALYSNLLPASQPVYYNAWFRLQVLNRPSIDCPNLARDGFTTNPTNGNGALTYPVGLMTADEAVMAGMTPFKMSGSNVNNTTFINDSFGTDLIWTMTPSIYGVDGSNDGVYGRDYHYSGDASTMKGVYYPAWNTRWIRPVIALKYDTYIKKSVNGDGSYGNPLALEW